MGSLVIVESPAKAKTIEGYLGKGYKVRASFGHIRELPPKDGSVDTTSGDFVMEYQLSSKASKAITEIVSLAKESDEILLAPDPDREGEAIAWHIQEVLKLKKVGLKDKVVKRITFNQITKNAVLDAIKNPREIDKELVDAQSARLALDYLMGFNISPVLWRKLPGAKSAGRVQSVALRLVCEREAEIEIFKKEEYWSIEALFDKIPAILETFDSKKLDKMDITNEQQAEEIKATLLAVKSYSILDVSTKETKRKPYAPYTTSTLQQDSSSKLGFGAKMTMQLAQKLYEGIKIGSETKGLITYMRTDSTTISEEGIKQIRSYIKKDIGSDYLSPSVNIYKTKAKNSQEAHEAIRPTDASITPEYAKSYLDEREFKLYELIWKRAIASQASDAKFEATKIEISSQDSKHIFKANGNIMLFDGFLKIYDYSESDDVILPKIKVGDILPLNNLDAKQHFTMPPPRYNEASLVKKLEELGIGRPSTYATTLSVIQEREYVKLDERKRFVPEERGRVVSAFLESFFARYVDYQFTAGLEEELDGISNGDVKRADFLSKFWTLFKQNVDEALKTEYTKVSEALEEKLKYHFFKQKEDGSIEKKCPSCQTGKLGLRIGKFGPFVTCSNYPECKYIRNTQTDSSSDEDEKDGSQPISTLENTLIGQDDKGINIYLKKGPYGLYLELQDGAKKPKRATVPKNTKPSDVTLQFAKNLLSLPKKIGNHPDTNEEIVSGLGMYGPYLLYKKKYYKLQSIQDAVDIDINRSVSIIASQTKV